MYEPQSTIIIRAQFLIEIRVLDICLGLGVRGIVRGLHACGEGTPKLARLCTVSTIKLWKMVIHLHQTLHVTHATFLP